MIQNSPLSVVRSKHFVFLFKIAHIKSKFQFIRLIYMVVYIAKSVFDDFYVECAKSLFSFVSIFSFSFIFISIWFCKYVQQFPIVLWWCFLVLRTLDCVFVFLFLVEHLLRSLGQLCCIRWCDAITNWIELRFKRENKTQLCCYLLAFVCVFVCYFLLSLLGRLLLLFFLLSTEYNFSSR